MPTDRPSASLAATPKVGILGKTRRRPIINANNVVEPHFFARGEHCVLGVVAGNEGFERGAALAELTQVVEILKIYLLLAGGQGLQLVVEATGDGLIIGSHKKENYLFGHRYKRLLSYAKPH